MRPRYMPKVNTTESIHSSK